jgi:FlaA1/EpsC-like NDP-sugar epimerase
MPKVRIVDLIGVLRETIGNGHDKVEHIGPKPGEKLYEELLTSEEEARTLEMPDMFAVLPAFRFKEIDFTYPEAKPLRSAGVHSSESGPFMSRENIAGFLRSIGLV